MKYHTGRGRPGACGSRYDAAMRLTILHVVAGLATAILANGHLAAQVYKCVDAAGRTTYQQTPCPVAQKGGRMDIQSGNGTVRDSADQEAAWAQAAAAKNIVAGMPKRVVRAALGDPTGMRSAKDNENAAEIWTYRRPGEVMVIGFVNDVVAWYRTDGAPDSILEPLPVVNRREVASIGRDCGDVLRILGPPVAVEAAPAWTSQQGEAPVPAQRHIYDPVTSNDEPLMITCAAARVVAVERAPPR